MSNKFFIAASHAFSRSIFRSPISVIVPFRTTWVLRRRHIPPYDPRVEYGIEPQLEDPHWILPTDVDMKYFIYDAVQQEIPKLRSKDQIKEFRKALRKAKEKGKPKRIVKFQKRVDACELAEKFADLRVERPPIQVVLLREIEGLGERGDVVEVNRWKARDVLLPLGWAVYASPYNVGQFAKPAEERAAKPPISPEQYRTLLHLKRMKLYIPMNPASSWTLSKSHVRIALRRLGVIADEANIELPEQPVTNASTEPFHVTLLLGPPASSAPPATDADAVGAGLAAAAPAPTCATVRVRVHAEVWRVAKLVQASGHAAALSIAQSPSTASPHATGAPPAGAPKAGAGAPDEELEQAAPKAEPPAPDMLRVVWHPNDVFARPTDESWR